MLLLPEGCLVRLLLPLLFLLRELDEADVEADLNSSDNTTVIEGQLKKGGKLFLTPNILTSFLSLQFKVWNRAKNRGKIQNWTRPKLRLTLTRLTTRQYFHFWKSGLQLSNFNYFWWKMKLHFEWRISKNGKELFLSQRRWCVNGKFSSFSNLIYEKNWIFRLHIEKYRSLTQIRVCLRFEIPVGDS